MMLPTETGLHLTEQFEGCRLEAYQDAGGVWTIGYGHTGPDVHEGLTILPEEARAMLRIDYVRASRCVDESVRVQLTQHEYDALCDFVFNVGCGAFRASTLLRKLNAGDYQGAGHELLRWDHVSGRVLQALLQRREAELDLWGSNISEGAD